MLEIPFKKMDNVTIKLNISVIMISNYFKNSKKIVQSKFSIKEREIMKIKLSKILLSRNRNNNRAIAFKDKIYQYQKINNSSKKNKFL
jgi:hypothetical protein